MADFGGDAFRNATFLTGGAVATVTGLTFTGCVAMAVTVLSCRLSRAVLVTCAGKKKVTKYGYRNEDRNHSTTARCYTTNNYDPHHTLTNSTIS